MTGFCRLFIGCLVLLVLVLCGCATGPSALAQKYNQAVRSGDAHAICALLEDSQCSTDSSFIDNALVRKQVNLTGEGRRGQETHASATVSIGNNQYLMVEQSNGWRMQCSTIGPYHDRSPEATLLLALHLIETNNFTALRRLAPQNLEIADAPWPESFTESLIDWAGALSAHACQPFRIDRNHAELTYGEDGRQTVKMLNENGHWRIEELW